LKDWEETDEPWKEHARWFVKCPFVLAVKGKQFIDEANGMGKIPHQVWNNLINQIRSSVM
jgi:hypothetical protein